MYKSVLIGLGNIGIEYDYKLSIESYALTHAQALQKNNNFDLLLGIDISKNQRSRFNNKYNLPTLSIVSKKILEYEPALVTIAVNTNNHLNELERLFNICKPKVVLVEKPLAFELKDAERIVELSDYYKIPIAVNYFREFEPAHRNLIKIIKNNLGFPLNIIVHYSGGLKNMGSHFLQYLSNFMGEVLDINIIDKGEKINDYDFSPSLRIKYKKGDAYFISTINKGLSIVEMELIGKNGKIKYHNNGRYYEKWGFVRDSVFDKNQVFDENPSQHRLNFNNYQSFVYDNINDFLNGQNELYCNVKNCIQTAHLLDKIDKELSK